jgi:hypothetical protein
MTDRDDVPVHADHEPDRADHETTSQTPPSAVVMADDPAAGSPVDQRTDEQPYFLIDSGDEGVADASADATDPAAEHPAETAEPVAEIEATTPQQTGFGFSEEPDAPTDAPAAVVADEDGNELPEDLRALNEMLDRPTAEIMPVSADATAEEAASSAVGDDAQAIAESAGEAIPAESPEAAPSALDDIAPGTVAGAEAVAESEAAETGEAEVAAPEAAAELSAAAADAALPEGVATKVSWWPFVGYMVVWLGAASYAVWQLQMLPTGQAAYESDLYSQTMLGALVLLGMGPALLLVVWLASWIGRKGAKIGSMFISALVKGATATLFGAVVWMGALMLIDYLRLGRPF